MKIQPLKGTKDFLPEEMQIRDFVQNKIISVYKSSGFVRISTPIIEDMENLDKSEGGDNLNLIFKILKRGDKLQKAITGENVTESDMSDMGLRYDLTLPLSRYYAANKDKLPQPFKVIQTDRVYRAERPQKGRMREFVQCDIDIVGDKSINAETELIHTTAMALCEVGFSNLTIVINDRRILKGMLLGFGFKSDDIQSACVTFDKLEKIGIDGIKQEFEQKQMSEQAVNALCNFLNEADFSLEKVKSLLSDEDVKYAHDLQSIIETTEKIGMGKYKTQYSPQLVRGQGYYTGVVFEVTSPEFKGAIGGGGRYDDMIGKFLKTQVPAVGFSIGFERIISILLDNKYKVPNAKQRIALLYNSTEQFTSVMQKAEELRQNSDVTILSQSKKVGKQIQSLADFGYDGVCFSEKYPQIKMIAGETCE